MKEPDINVYIEVMKEIKHRTSVIYSFLRGTSSALYRATQVESIYLQIRIILELIALASIAANRAIFEENGKKFRKNWNLVDILKSIETINPSYYPKPIREVPSAIEGIKSDFPAIESGYLTKEELIEFHGRAANILHARNPYKEKLNYKEYEAQIMEIMGKIRCLLSCHRIVLLGEQDFFYLIHMKEDRDDLIHYYKFQEKRADTVPIEKIG